MLELIYNFFRNTVFTYDDAYFNQYDAMIDAIVWIMTISSLLAITLFIIGFIVRAATFTAGLIGRWL